MIYYLREFIKYGVHIGHYKWECDYRLSYFLLGIRNSIHIINLYYTLFILKQGLYIAYNMCVLGQKLLVANNVGYKLNSFFEKINQKYLWYINDKWIGGLLTNQRGIFLNNEKLFLNVYGLGYSALLPSYVFASNVKETTSCIFEAIILNIPSSSLIDSNMGLYGIFYGLPANDDNFVSMYLFSKLFMKMYLKSIYDNLNSFKIAKNSETPKEYQKNKLVKRIFRKYHKNLRRSVRNYVRFGFNFVSNRINLNRINFGKNQKKWVNYAWSIMYRKQQKLLTPKLVSISKCFLLCLYAVSNF